MCCLARGSELTVGNPCAARLSRENAVIGHSILNLVQRAARYAGGLSALHVAKKLDEVYIPSRYPNGLEDTCPRRLLHLAFK